ncbi:MAG: AtzG-like protein [Hydrogenophaga sp.]|uniref:AtzG-like protein n=1 Tax=Hydrogenophaga sp. TaxID=1904254 RepID=UPI003D138643
MTQEQTLAYVQAAAVAVDLQLDTAQAARVAAHMHRTAAMAELLDAFPLKDEDEVAEIYCPAPFVAEAR